MDSLIVVRGNTVEVPVSLAFNVSADTLVSSIRETEDPDSDVIAEWDISFVTDGKDGELLFTLDGDITDAIVEDIGYMFFISLNDGDPIDIFDVPVTVEFVDP